MVAGKLTTLEAALARIEDGAVLTAGGFAHSHQPLGFLRALIRSGRRDLALVGIAECWVAEWLAAAGMLRRSWFSNFMFEGFGRCRCFSRGVESGLIAVEDHSHYGIITRLRAAGQRLRFLPMGAMAGTDILDRPGFEAPAHKAARIGSPFGPEEVTVVSPLAPDVAVIHAARADEAGNVQLFGNTAVIREQAAAARTVVVTVEEIVPGAVIRRSPEHTLLPALMVDHVVHLPYGAHPTGVYGYYDHDAAFLADYYAASRDDDAVTAWLTEWAHGPADHFDYLDRLGAQRLMSLRVDPVLGYRLEGGR